MRGVSIENANWVNVGEGERYGKKTEGVRLAKAVPRRGRWRTGGAPAWRHAAREHNLATRGDVVVNDEQTVMKTVVHVVVITWQLRVGGRE